MKLSVTPLKGCAAAGPASMVSPPPSAASRRSSRLAVLAVLCERLSLTSTTPSLYGSPLTPCPSTTASGTSRGPPGTPSGPTPPVSVVQEGRPRHLDHRRP